MLLVLGRHAGVLAPVPLWALLGSMAVAHVGAVAFATLHAPGSSRARPVPFLAVTIGLAGLLVYVTGWGAALAAVFLAPAIVVMQADGARYGRAAAVVIAATVAAGEIAVELRIVPTMLPSGTSHAVAGMETAVAVIVTMLVARGQRAKEQAETRERESVERFRALVQHASDAIIVVEDGGHVRYASPAVERLFGIPPDALGSFDLGWIDPDHADAAAALWRDLRARPGAVVAIDVPLRHADGTSRWVEVHFANLTENPAVGAFVCNVRDIGERRAVHQQLVHDAHHDALTRLPNRRAFLARLDVWWRGATPDDTTALLFVDVDNFKQINDACGHDTGDKVLVAVAEKLTALVRPTDVLSRFGGDEFVVLLERLATVDDAFDVAARITGAIAGPCRVNGNEVVLSVSVGVATATGRSVTADELLRDADRAMYLSKQGGRARWTPWTRTHAAATAPTV